MASIAFHPGLESHVIANDRPFPEITEQPGRPVQAALTETVQPVLAEFYRRFVAHDFVPLIVDFGPNEEGFHAIVQLPDEIRAIAGNLDHENGTYSDLRVVAPGSYITPVLEAARFTYTAHKIGLGADYPAPRYQFGVCAGLGLRLDKTGAETAEGAEKIGAELAQQFGSLAVGREFSEMDLSPLQKEHLHWLGVMLSGYYLQTQPQAWASRAPEPDQLAQYREELASKVPDSQSAELLPAVFALVQQVAELGQRQLQRIGENYTLTDQTGRVLAGQPAR